ncbi:3-isopropylmalate dehydratase small subunit [Bosea sp. (in: a-proteobacteria)]|uniref:3-isopropylmalate dehydratase small subunit n=1 Tax=Bosea sp. (in: a-proteobacteria) TaxID=1871050 RepID=UPI00261735EF|nr:3-isopropylmalate dehydratase small subunit [Bosea sp. (in: a-proteobacteria)]MCO5089637.1 3-isopropylmalate dehydratase small subunit [Bosea sp. (in: a-proteobacteria)]
MQKVSVVDGVAAHFRQPNIDTDAIIPVSYQRSLKQNPGIGLFGGWRYDLNGEEVADFILNREPYRNSKIIVGGVNFGCGSSREFAVWAMKGFGIECIIAESFGDIFYENSFKNGLLLVTMSSDEIARLQDHLEHTNNPSMSVDLLKNLISLPNGVTLPFAIPEARRRALIEGLDEIGQTLCFEQDIRDFQAKLRAQQPWIWPGRADMQLSATGT